MGVVGLGEIRMGLGRMIGEAVRLILTGAYLHSDLSSELRFWTTDFLLNKWTSQTEFTQN